VTRCERTDLLASDCAHCKGLDEQKPTRRKPEMGSWFPARYDGHCSDCKTEFVAGEQIRSDGETGYVGECCGEDED
jgi:hypothetical protein